MNVVLGIVLLRACLAFRGTLRNADGALDRLARCRPWHRPLVPGPAPIVIQDFRGVDV
jgi:hypothetical protein